MYHMLDSRIYPKIIYKIITFHIELNNGQTVISFSFMLFFILLKILILKEPINFVSNAILYYLLVI